jgi:hypothetical protein
LRLASERDHCVTIVVRWRGTVIMRMSKYKMFKMIDCLAQDTAKSAQLNIDDDAIQRRHTRTARITAGFSETDEAAPQSETRSRSAYYAVIARAVSRLPNNTREARQALYDRAGVALAAQLLDGQDPPVSDAQVASERLAFERAIRKVEGEARKREQPTAREQLQEKGRRPFSPFLSSFLKVFKP